MTVDTTPPTGSDSSGRFGSPIVPPELGGDLSGTVIGPYRLTTLMGEGGMGVVYEAVRIMDYDDHVAIKLIRRSIASVDERVRFRAERQTLAHLRHPGIAALLDGGEDSDGRPYLVMELIKGQRIDAYCRARALAFRDRVDLFREVCAAVSYAHQMTVVHRDIKPSNVMVCEDGAVRLLDFGIAKAIEPLGDESRLSTPQTTEAGGRFTAAYASPEQLRRATGGDDPVSTATDIYSLGVLLCELMTDRLPIDVRGCPLHEVIRRVCDDEPEIPTKIACGDGARFAKELAAIIRRTLHKSPERRYASVADLSEDLWRLANGLPINARQYGWAARTAKFYRRHRVATTIVLAVALAAVAVVVAALAASETQRQSKQASLAGGQRAATYTFMDLLLSSADPTRLTSELTVAELVTTARDAEVWSAFGGHPEAEGTFKLVAGRVLQRLGLLQDAEPLLIDAAALLERNLDPSHSSLVDVHTALGELYAATGAFEAALKESDRLFSVLEAVGAPDTQLAGIELERMSLLGALGETEQAQAIAAEITPLILEGDRNSALSVRLLCELAELAVSDSRPDDAVALAQRALSICGGSSDPAVLWLESDAHLALATALQDQGELEAAYAELHAAVASAVALLGGEHPKTLGHQLTLGIWCSEDDDPVAAISAFEESLPAYRARMGDHHPFTLRVLRELASCYLRVGRSADAEVAARTVLDHLAHVDATISPEAAQARTYLLRSLLRLGRIDEADELRIRVLDDISQGVFMDHNEALRTLLWLIVDSVSANHREGIDPLIPPLRDLVAEAASSGGDIQSLDALCEYLISQPVDAAAACLPLVEISSGAWDVATGKCSNESLGALERHAIVTSTVGVDAEAASLFRELLHRRRERFGTEHESTLATAQVLAAQLAEMEDFQGAHSLLAETMALCEQCLAPGHAVTVAAMHTRAVVYYQEGDPDNALALWEQAVRIARDETDEERVGLANVLLIYSKCLLRAGQRKRAAALMLRADVLCEDNPLVPDSLRHEIEDRLTSSSGVGDGGDG